mmetsp:Transcript_20650/g.26643  ORF Transcript_20650/g.26643 Transcript_20650/m.26643 type:complete len:230 (+) Transcript_20650:138-827(+)
MTASINYSQPRVMNDFATATSTSSLQMTLPAAIDNDYHRQFYFSMHCQGSLAGAKRVRFSDNDRVIPIPSPLDQLKHGGQHQLSGVDFPEIWHSVTDMDTFRKEARNLCRMMRLTGEGAPANVCTMAQNQQTRGLESRSCLERQRRKLLASKCIVRAQSKLEPDRLAALAQRCTSWASILAQEEAARDHVRAQSSCEDLAAAGFKRTLEKDDSLFSERRVRQRTSAPDS